MFDKIITNTEHSEKTNGVYLSFLLTSILLIYFIMDKFKNNFFTPNQVKLFDEYYHDNKFCSLFIDHIFVLTYMSISFLIISLLLKTKITINMNTIILSLLVITIVTVLLDLLIGFRVKDYSGSNKTIDFFKRWSKEAGIKAIIWDLIYLYSIFFVALLLLKYNVHNNIYAVTIFFVLFLAHIFV